MIVLNKSIRKKLKKITERFPNKESIDIEDAKEFILNSTGISKTNLDEDAIEYFLKEKGYINITKKKNKEKKEIEEKNSIEIKNTTKRLDDEVIDIDLSLDDILDLDFDELCNNDDYLISKNIDIDKCNYNDNIYKIDKYLKTKDESILSDLIIQNERLVGKYVEIYKTFLIGNPSLDEHDLMQVGMIGLQKAIERFDTSKGYDFSTYATWWIKQCISREMMDHAGTVRVPVHLNELMLKMNRIEKESIIEKNYIDKEYVCNKMDIDIDKYEYLKKIRYQFFKLVCLDCPLNEESDDLLVDFVDYKNALVNPSEEFMDPLEIIEKKLLVEAILECLDGFNERQKNIFLYRYGFIDGIPHTLEEIGKIYNITRERVRRIERQVFNNIRKSEKIRTVRNELFNI